MLTSVVILRFKRSPKKWFNGYRAMGVKRSCENVTLSTHGDRDTDMFVVLDGAIDVVLRSLNGGHRVFARHRRHQFSGELSLLNSQRAVTEARTVMDSLLLRISRKELRLLMRSEGDIANIIVSAAIWRRIGILADASGGVLLRGSVGDADLMHLQRFFVRNYYPHRTEEIPKDDGRAGENSPIRQHDRRQFRKNRILAALVTCYAFRFRAYWFVLAQTEGEDTPIPPIPGFDIDAALCALNITRTPFDELNGNIQGFALGREIAVPIPATLVKTADIVSIARKTVGNAEFVSSFVLQKKVRTRREDALKQRE